jgi:hypothetical protein
VILKDSAADWFALRYSEEDAINASWVQWKAFFLQRYETDSWKRLMRSRLRSSRYPDPVKTGTQWITSFIRLNKSVEPTISVDTLKGNILSALPQDMALLLSTRAQTRPGSPPVMLTEFVQMFLELTSLREATYIRRPNGFDTVRSSAGVTRPFQPRATNHQPPVRLHSGSSRLANQKMGEKTGSQQSAAPAKANTGRPFKCFKCQQSGHTARFCPNVQASVNMIELSTDDGPADEIEEEQAQQEEMEPSAILDYQNDGYDNPEAEEESNETYPIFILSVDTKDSDQCDLSNVIGTSHVATGSRKRNRTDEDEAGVSDTHAQDTRCLRRRRSRSLSPVDDTSSITKENDASSSPNREGPLHTTELSDQGTDSESVTHTDIQVSTDNEDSPTVEIDDSVQAPNCEDCSCTDSNIDGNSVHSETIRSPTLSQTEQISALRCAPGDFPYEWMDPDSGWHLPGPPVLDDAAMWLGNGQQPTIQALVVAEDALTSDDEVVPAVAAPQPDDWVPNIMFSLDGTMFVNALTRRITGNPVIVRNPSRPVDWHNATSAQTIAIGDSSSRIALISANGIHRNVLPAVSGVPTQPDRPTEEDWQGFFAWYQIFALHRTVARRHWTPNREYSSDHPSRIELDWLDECLNRAEMAFETVQSLPTYLPTVWRHFHPVVRAMIYTRQLPDSSVEVYLPTNRDRPALLLPEEADYFPAMSPDSLAAGSYFNPLTPEEEFIARGRRPDENRVPQNTPESDGRETTPERYMDAVQVQALEPLDPLNLPSSLQPGRILLLAPCVAALAPSAGDSLTTDELRRSVKAAGVIEAECLVIPDNPGTASLHGVVPTLAALLNNQSTHVMFDTGAAVSAIAQHLLATLDPVYLAKLKPSKLRQIHSLDGAVEVIGLYPTPLLFPHHMGAIRINVELLVLCIPAKQEATKKTVLLGSDWISLYGIDLISSSGRFIKFGKNKQKFLIPRRTMEPHPCINKLDASEADEVIDAITFGPDLSTHQIDECKSMLEGFHEAFSSSKRPLGTYRGPKVRWEIDHPGITDSPPTIPSNLRKAPYPISPKSNDIMRKAIQGLLDLGVIVPSKSPYSSPALLVLRPNKKPRLVLDYRQINQHVIPDSYPMPRIDHSMSKLSGAKYITTLDANHGFHQLVMEDSSMQYTAFAIQGGLYQWTRMPQGAKNAPAAFQRAMDNILHEELREGWVIVYIDDVIVYSDTWQDHLLHLQKVCQKMILWGITLSPAKSKIGFATIAALGHILSGMSIAVDESKTAAVKHWPSPKTVKELQQFLGFASYYRAFIPNFGGMTRSLTSLLSKDVAWQWTPERHEAFEAVKASLICPKTLALPDSGKDFIVHIDASFIGLGATLSQIQDGNERPICFISRKLRDTELRYGATQLECLAVIWALEKLHYYLESSCFEVVTDCQAVLSLINMKTPNRHMLRWQLAIQQYRGKMTLRYREGKKNTNVDGLSRAPLDNDNSNPAAGYSSDEDTTAVCVLSVVNLDDEFYQKIRDGYDKEKNAELLKRILDKPTPEKQALAASLDTDFLQEMELGKFFIYDGLIYHKEGLSSTLLVVDKDTQLAILDACHDEITSAHFSFEKTLEKVRLVAWWPGMSSTVEAYAASCETCQKANKATGKRFGLLQRMAPSKIPWENINMDFVTGLPVAGDSDYNACIVVVDRLSRSILMIPTHDTATAPETARLFWNHCVCQVGIPRVIISDRDPKFTSEFWKSLFKLSGTKLAFSTAHHPQTDGLAERAIQTLEDMLRRYIAFGLEYKDDTGTVHDWVSLLPALQLAYNSTKQSTTGRTPFEIERGYIPNIPRLLPLKGSAVFDRRAEGYAEMQDAAREHALQCISAAFDSARKDGMTIIVLHLFNLAIKC